MTEYTSKEGWQIWIDRGGTFTDIVAKCPDGKLISHKILSENPEQYDDAAIQGIRDLLNIEKNEIIPSELIDGVKMGTTVATNALLERKGDRTVFVTTKGFGDCLRIGYQARPDIFARHIVLPELLYEDVIEVDERVGAHGELIVPLNIEKVKQQLLISFNKGIRSIAITLLHGHKYHDHEKQLKDIASSIGFTQISVGHEVSSLMKLISRGDTTVVDAYLSPILRRYVEQVECQLKPNNEAEPRLMFMQSNGGLTDAKFFHGRDAILSGPAGGVVGMVRTAELAGYKKLIGFDMGGTSTDVTHFDGEFERSFETVVAGVRMRAPMMYIHTVAAGGGSILHFDGSRLRVGPDSSGANPGPACYRRGGPLAVTDCNVMLGKLQPEFFPKVFGLNAKEALDRDIVRDKFKDLAQKISTATRTPLKTPEEIAEGYLRIAVENMANAIKKISVQRGYDVTDYTLNCFGGAGGQHACLVADTLGIKRVFLHPFAGVLSAYGMGLADIRALREEQVEVILSSEQLNDVHKICDRLSQNAKQEILSQGIQESKIYDIRKVHLRFEGTDTPLSVELGSYEAMVEVFDEQYKKRFGFIPSGKQLIVEAVIVEAVGETQLPDSKASLEVFKTQHSDAATYVSMYSEGKTKNVPLYDRESLAYGQKIQGPAIISETTGTIIVEYGWTAELNNLDHLILTRTQEIEHYETISTKVDPIMLEVFNNMFMSIAEQMGYSLQNTAQSVNIKERLDFSCALFDPDGNLVANAPHVPVHLGSMGQSIKAIIKQNEGQIKSGNVYAQNAPYNGGTHLPDITVITPVFDAQGEKILFYTASRGHHADVGGRTPGSAPPDSTSIEEEGVLIDNWLLVEQGRLRESQTRELLLSGRYPCRNIDQNLSDLTAQIAANETGVQELQKMIKHFGHEVVIAYMGHVQDNAEESVRRILQVLKDGCFTYPMDNGNIIKVDIKVDQDKRQATIDFTGTSDQHSGNYNAPFAVCQAAVLYVFRTLVRDNIPLNEGCMKPLNIVVPERNMLNPEYPAAVFAGNTEVSQCITDALYGALGILSSSQGTMNNFVYGNDIYQNYETICGGTGAGQGHDGTDAVHSHMTNTRMTDPEVLEWRFPIRIHETSIRHGSGGDGKYRGGSGIVRKIEFLEPMTATILSSHRKTEPYGLEGGMPGLCGKNYVIKKDGSICNLEGNDEVEMNSGDTFVIETPGAGGYGKIEG